MLVEIPFYGVPKIRKWQFKTGTSVLLHLPDFPFQCFFELCIVYQVEALATGGTFKGTPESPELATRRIPIECSKAIVYLRAVNDSSYDWKHLTHLRWDQVSNINSCHCHEFAERKALLPFGVFRLHYQPP